MADFRAFLDAAGWGDAACEPLTGDASARKYFRLRKPDHSAILMDASRILDSVAPFIRIGEHLRNLGFSAPEIFARDEAAGLLLLEDFGDTTFAQLLDKAPNADHKSPSPPCNGGEGRGEERRLFPAQNPSPRPSPRLDGEREIESLPSDFLFALATD